MTRRVLCLATSALLLDPGSMIPPGRGAPSVPRAPRLEVTLGEPVKLVEGGTFPYLFCFRGGVLVLQVEMLSQAAGKAGEQRPHRTLRSEDGGVHWAPWLPGPGQEPGPAVEGAVVERRDGTILIYDYIPRPLGAGKFATTRWESRDGWKTVRGPLESRFEIPQAIDRIVGDDGNAVAGVLCHRSVLELPTGALLAAVYGRFQGDEASSEYLPQMKKFRSLLLRSEDQGVNWRYVATIAVDPAVGQEGFCEPVLLRLATREHRGRLLCLMRTGRKNPLYQSHSDDEGRTWSRAVPLALQGVDPDLIELGSGVLVCSFGHKPATSSLGGLSANGNFLAFSLDQGRTWGHVTELSSTATCAYTTVRETGPGELYVVYDERDPRDYRSPNRRVWGRRVTVALRD